MSNHHRTVGDRVTGLRPDEDGAPALRLIPSVAPAEEDSEERRAWARIAYACREALSELHPHHPERGEFLQMWRECRNAAGSRAEDPSERVVARARTSAPESTWRLEARAFRDVSDALHAISGQLPEDSDVRADLAHIAENYGALAALRDETPRCRRPLAQVLA